MINKLCYNYFQVENKFMTNTKPVRKLCFLDFANYLNFRLHVIPNINYTILHFDVSMRKNRYFTTQCIIMVKRKIKIINSETRVADDELFLLRHKSK